MPGRWATSTRVWVYKYLVLRDGEFCQRCGHIPTTHYSLDIDHIDGVKSNNVQSNLRLLCRTCNVAIGNRSRGKARERPKCQGERENPITRVTKEAVPYHNGSPEMQANALFEAHYREWLIDFVTTYGFITRDEAVNAGAEVVGCNPTTASKYLSKLTSLAGPLHKTKDMLGDVVITMKADQRVRPNKEATGK